MVAVGLARPITSPCARPTDSPYATSVMNIRVRTTWSIDAPVSTSAVAMISKQRFAWTYGSGSTDPFGDTGAVPDTSTRSPARKARQKPIVFSNGDPELTRRRSFRAA